MIVFVLVQGPRYNNDSFHISAGHTLDVHACGLQGWITNLLYIIMWLLLLHQVNQFLILCCISVGFARTRWRNIAKNEKAKSSSSIPSQGPVWFGITDLRWGVQNSREKHLGPYYWRKDYTCTDCASRQTQKCLHGVSKTKKYVTKWF